MPCDTWLHTSRNAAIATTGAPRSSQSWRMCARGSSPRQIATMGLRNPRPTRESTRMALSMAPFTRGKRAFETVAADGFAGGCGAGAAAAGMASAAFALFADDITALDLLLPLQAEGELFDVRIRLVAVIFDAVDELFGRCAEAIGREIEVGGVGLLLGDEFFRGLREHVGAIDLLRRLEEPRIRLALGDLAPASHLREVPDGVRVERIVGVILEEHVEIRKCALVATAVLESAGHAVGDDAIVGAHVFGTGQ